MKNIIELAFLYEGKDMKNAPIEKDLKEAKNKIIDKVDQMKFTKEFINDFMGMYDKEQLYKILVVIQREIQKRSRDEINNIVR